jgi:hypothetical protein
MKLGSLFDGLYLITEDGRLYSARRKKYLRPSIDKSGYLYYVISINGVRGTYKAHRLVALAFLPNPENKPTVDHRNGVRTDNRVENLAWATIREQFANPITQKRLQEMWSKTDYRVKGSRRNFGRKPTIVYHGNEKIGEYPSLLLAAAAVGVSCAKASECANGKRRAIGGFRFCYE